MNLYTKNLTIFATIITLSLTGNSINLNKKSSDKFSNKVNKYTSTFTKDNFSIAAHRGYSSKEIENSKKAIILANNSPYIDYIELDLRLTKDKKLVLSHNSDITNNTLSKNLIEKNNYDYLKKLTITSSPNYLEYTTSLFDNKTGTITRKSINKLNGKTTNIITLKEVIKLTDKKILLDLKFKDNTEEFINALLKELSKNDIDTSKIIFQSTDLLSLLTLQKENPNLNISAIIKKEEDLDYAPLFNNLGIKKDIVNGDQINNYLNENKTIAIWTINKNNDVINIINELDDNYDKVIYITDYPGTIATLLEENKKKVKK